MNDHGLRLVMACLLCAATAAVTMALAAIPGVLRGG